MPGGVPRIEERTSKTVVVRLSNVDEPATEDMAFTENVSSHGVRAVTRRPWQPEQRLVVKSTQGTLRARARVVYCHQVEIDQFAIGLELFSPVGHWSAITQG